MFKKTVTIYSTNCTHPSVATLCGRTEAIEFVNSSYHWSLEEILSFIICLQENIQVDNYIDKILPGFQPRQLVKNG
jgi:hypothetical protein